MGGVSNERAVSLESGRNVVEGLKSLGRYEVVPVVLDAEKIDSLPAGTARVFIALHGGWGENGGVQHELDRLGIPYTGPSAAASRIAMDKVKTKEVLDRNSVDTPAWALAAPDAPACPLPLPAVVKPPCDGSSVGISKVSAAEEWAASRDAAVAAQGGAGDVLVEEYIPGREFTVPVLDGRPWSPIEIVAKDGWYGYDEKYNSNETRYPFVDEAERAADGEGLADKLRGAALAAYRAVGCRGMVRIDFRVSPEGRACVLELNTSPGFTSHSLVPKAGMRDGATFGEVCEKVLACAAYGEGGVS